YAGENQGWLPPGHSAHPGSVAGAISRTDGAFCDYGSILPDGTSPNPNRWAVSEAVARLANYKWSPKYDATLSVAQNYANGYVAVRTPIFCCPASSLLVGSGANISEIPDNNLLNHDPALVGGDGNSQTKIKYLWVANPFH